jgi:hypothetical protein
MALNALKFGSPFETGYRYLYAGRTDPAAADAQQHGIFALRYVPRNFYYTNFGFPEVVTTGGLVRFKPDATATGIWWTTPLLLYVLRERRRVWADPATRRLLLASGAVFAALLLYHTAGGHQTGMNRFSLDYGVVWLGIVSACFDTARACRTRPLWRYTAPAADTRRSPRR